jgi:hypothetical protein
MTTARSLGMFFITLSLASGAATAQSLGRLFYSDAERARLEQQRDSGERPGSPPATTGSLRNDGVVRRSGGPATWFVNGAALDERSLTSVAAQPAGTALKLRGEDGQVVRLRPGEHTAVDDSGQAAPASGVINIRKGAAK